jgi:hypothetical protein
MIYQMPDKKKARKSGPSKGQLVGRDQAVLA